MRQKRSETKNFTHSNSNNFSSRNYNFCNHTENDFLNLNLDTHYCVIGVISEATGKQINSKSNEELILNSFCENEKNKFIKLAEIGNTIKYNIWVEPDRKVCFIFMVEVGSKMVSIFRKNTNLAEDFDQDLFSGKLNIWF